MAFGILYDFLMGQTIEAYKYFGAHFEKRIIELKEKLVHSVWGNDWSGLIRDKKISVFSQGAWSNEWSYQKLLSVWWCQ